MKLRKPVATIATVTMAGVVMLAGCSPSGSTDGAALTIAKPDGAIPTESNNPYLADSSASKYSYGKVIFEPLALVNQTGDLGTTPWLAESVEWNADYTELTVVARDGVTWSDGEEFTTDDIVFTFDQFLTGKLADTSALKYVGSTVDGSAVTLKFAESKYTAQARVLHTPIVPKHIWENIEDPNSDPLTGEGQVVGTGPYTLTNWSPESVTLTARDDYWGGELAVPQLNYVSYGDNAALTTALVSGEADWAQAFLPQIQESFLAADEKNHLWAAPTSGVTMMVFNLQKKPFNDPALREALAWTIDRDSFVEGAREGLDEPIWNITGLGTVLADEILPEYAAQEYSVDIDKAKRILTDAGYTWEKEKLIDPDGEAVSFTFIAPAGWSDWNTAQALISEELGNALGIEVEVDQTDWGIWDAAKQEGSFDVTLHWIEDTGNAFGLYTSSMDPKWIVNDKAQFNFGRFDDPAVTAALSAYSAASDDSARKEALAVLEKAYSDQIPVIALSASPLLGEYNTRNYTGFPTDEDPYAPADPIQPNVVQVLTKLKPVE